MNAADFKDRALAHLERLETTEMEAIVNDQSGTDWLLETHDRFQHARVAFPGMTWEEFVTVCRRRIRVARGRPKAIPNVKANEKLFLAARDVDRIRDFWRGMSGKARGIPVDPIEIAAARHAVDETALADLVQRPLSRRYDRQIPRP